MIYQVTIRSSFDPTALKSGEAETNAYFDRMVVKAKQAADQIEKEMARVGPKIVTAQQKAALTPTAPNITTSVGSGQAQAATTAAHNAAAQALTAHANASTVLTTSINSGLAPALAHSTAATVGATTATNAQHASTQQLTTSSLALGVAMGEGLVQAAELFIDRAKSLISYVALTASRTEELGFALEAVAKANDITSSSIIGQENAVRRLNITTSDARAVLIEMVQAQLDTTKATQLATVAQDLAVVSGVSSVEELRRLTHGIQTMQPLILRQAGIFTNADEAYAKYAKTMGTSVTTMSTTAKQSAIMNEVLLQGARAVGTYDAAMGSASKQIRSMERVQEEAAVAVGNFFQGPLKAGLAIEREALELITKYPGALIILTAGIGYLSVAMIALNATTSSWVVTALAAAGNAIPAMISGVGALVTSVVTGSAVAEGAIAGATMGISLLVTALALVVYGIYKYATATEELVAVDNRRLNTLNAVITATKDDIESLQKSTTTAEERARADGQIEGALLRLDPLIRENILLHWDSSKGLDADTKNRKALTDALAAQNVEYAKQRDLQLGLVVIAGAAAAKVKDEQEAQMKGLEATRTELSKPVEQGFVLNTLNKVTGGFLGAGDEGLGQVEAVADNLKAIDELGKAMAKGNPELKTAAESLAEASRQGNKFGAVTVEAARAYIQLINKVREQTVEVRDLNKGELLLADEMVRINLLARDQANAFKGAAGMAELLKQALKDFKQPVFDITKSTDFLVAPMQEFQDRLKDIVATNEEAGSKIGRSRAESQALSFREAKDGLVTMDKLAKGVYATKAAYDAYIATLDPLTQVALRSVSANNLNEKSFKSLTEQVDYTAESMVSAREAIKQLNVEVPLLRKGGGALLDLQFEQQQLAQEQSQLQEILKLRKLYGIEGASVPESLAGREAEIRSLGRLTSAKNELATATEAQQTAEVALAVLIQRQAIPLVDAETRANTKILQGILDRKNAELELTATIKAAVEARTRAMKDEQDSLRDTRSAYQELQLDALQKAETARKAAIAANVRAAVATQNTDFMVELNNTVNMKTEDIVAPVETVAGNVMKVNTSVGTVATNVATVATKVAEVITQLGLIVTKMNQPTPAGYETSSILGDGAPNSTARSVLASVVQNPKFDAIIAKAAATQPQIDQQFLQVLMKATMYREGGGRDHPANSAGAEGWMQMIPGTAAANGVKDVHDLLGSLIGVAHLYAKRIEQVGYDKKELTATYFAGPGGGNRGEKTREYSASQAYVMDVALGAKPARAGELSPPLSVETNPLMTKDVAWHYKFTPEQFNALPLPVQKWVSKDSATKAELDVVKKAAAASIVKTPSTGPLSDVATITQGAVSFGYSPVSVPALGLAPTPELQESESYQAANREAVYTMIGGVPKTAVAKAAHAQSGRFRRRGKAAVIAPPGASAGKLMSRAESDKIGREPVAVVSAEQEKLEKEAKAAKDLAATLELLKKARHDAATVAATNEAIDLVTDTQNRYNDALETEEKTRIQLKVQQEAAFKAGQIDQRQRELSLEDYRVESALLQRETDRKAEDAKATTAAGIVEKDILQLKIAGSKEYTRVVVDGARARAAAEEDSLKKIIDQEDYLQKLRSHDPRTMQQQATKFGLERVTQAVSNEEQIGRLEDQIAHAGEDSADRVRIAWLKANKDIMDADTVAAESQVASQAKIADSTVYHSEQANAKVLEFLASQKSVTQTVADFKISVIQSGFDSIDKFFEKLGGHALTAKKLLADILASLTKMALSKVLAALMGIGTGGGGGVFSGGGGQSAGGGIGGILNFLGGNVRGSSGPSGGGLPAIFSSILGLPSGGGGGNFTGNSGSGGLFGGSGFLGAGTGGGQNSIQTFLNAINSPAPASSGAAAALGGLPFLGAFGAPTSLTSQASGLSSQGMAIQSLVGSLTGKAATGGSLTGGGGISGLFGAGGITGAIGPLLPLLGIAGGASLGSPSRTGSILGGVGGGLLGLGALAGLGSMGLAGGLGASALGFASSLGLGLGATSGPLMGLSSAIGGLFGGAGSSLGMFMGVAGPVALIAAPLIIGAIILAKNAARRRDEKTRNTLMVDSLGQLTELLDAVRHKRIDGESAVLSAMEVRKQYVAQAELLKDSKTKRIALQDVSRVDALVAQIRGAADVNIRQQEIAARIVPEFDEGGPVPPNVEMIAVRGDETLLKPTHVKALGGYDALSRAGVPGAGQSRMTSVHGLIPAPALPSGGRIAVPDHGRDTHILKARHNDVVLTKNQREALGGPKAMLLAGVPGYAEGGVVKAKTVRSDYFVPGFDMGGAASLAKETPVGRALTVVETIQKRAEREEEASQPPAKMVAGFNRGGIVQAFDMGGQISAFNAYGGGLAASASQFNAYGGPLSQSVSAYNAYGGGSLPAPISHTTLIPMTNTIPPGPPPSGAPASLSANSQSSGPSTSFINPAAPTPESQGGIGSIVIQELHIDIDEGKLIARGVRTQDGRTAVNMVVRQFVIDRK